MAITAIHPGKHLAEELNELRMSAAEFARQLNVPTNRITKSCMDGGQSPATRHYALRISLAQAQSSG
jgi:plasmid maintenance system antidote protein VapI